MGAIPFAGYKVKATKGYHAQPLPCYTGIKPCRYATQVHPIPTPGASAYPTAFNATRSRHAWPWFFVHLGNRGRFPSRTWRRKPVPGFPASLPAPTLERQQIMHRQADLAQRGCVTSTRSGSNFCGVRYAGRNLSGGYRRFSTKTASSSAVFDATGADALLVLPAPLRDRRGRNRPFPVIPARRWRRGGRQGVRGFGSVRRCAERHRGQRSIDPV